MSADSAWPRRLVVCCDGTWQSSVIGSENVPSNVTKLCRLVKRLGDDPNPKSDRKWHQVVYYDGGIGTGALSSWDKTKQGGTGLGLAENVIEAYNFIVLNYQPGDEIFCFGFSRGAYTARAVAGLVTDIGVIETRYLQIFPEIYRRYKANPVGTKFNLEAQKFEIQPDGDIAIPGSNKVKVVGVWDTVGSLGIPDLAWFDNMWSRSKYAFHNVSLNENIQHAFHALALDEHRRAFRPTLWYIHKDLKKAKAAEDLPELKQVWFPGVHINCGGGSDDSIGQMEGDREQLANVTFAWMLQCIAPYLTIDEKEFRKTAAQYQMWMDRIQHDCTYWHKGFFGKAGEWIPVSIPGVNSTPDELDPPKRDPNAHQHPDLDRRWGTGTIVDSFTLKYKANGSEPRVPGHCVTEFFNKETGKWEDQPFSAHGDTNEYIHPICAYRKMIRDDEKSALGAFNREFVPNQGKKGRYWWTHDNHALPEWVILEQDSPGYNFERFWYDQCAKENKEEGDWLANLDKNNNFDIKEKKYPWFYPKPSDAFQGELDSRPKAGEKGWWSRLTGW